MEGREFLDAADDLANGPGEAHWRTAVGRAYYALFLEYREAQRGWGLSRPSQNQSHRVVRLRLVVAGDPDLTIVSKHLEKLAAARATADYHPENTTAFATSQLVLTQIRNARHGITLLDQISADPVRRAAAVTAIKKTYP